MGRLSKPVLAALVIAAGCWCVSWLHREWKAQSLLEAGKQALEAGDFAEAGRWFAGVLELWPTHDEAAYQLGVCEQAGGRLDAAVQAWEREAARLIGVRRAVGLVEEALRGRRFVARL